MSSRLDLTKGDFYSGFIGNASARIEAASEIKAYSATR